MKTLHVLKGTSKNEILNRNKCNAFFTRENENVVCVKEPFVGFSGCDYETYLLVVKF